MSSEISIPLASRSDPSATAARTVRANRRARSAAPGTNSGPTLNDAYWLREVLTDIFETAPDRAAAAARLDGWAAGVKRLGASCFDILISRR